MTEKFPKNQQPEKDINQLSSSELNEIFYSKDGLRKFLAQRGCLVNAEFIQRGDSAEVEDLQKVLEIIEAVGLEKLSKQDQPLLFRAGYPSSPGQDPIIGLRDSKEQCVEIIKKWYLYE